ncbi:MAG: ATPase [Chloroflexi bacterium]|jgi:regulator of protease activity HflC (stomatin/prohibitin superfamily)|nr:ATPase [Chloroflexota bacterium]
MDILQLIDRLEEIFNESRAIPLTHSVIVDEDRMLDIIDQMRITVPEEVKKAQQILTQRDRILAQAQEEAERTLNLARERAEQMVQQSTIVVEAQKEAERILNQAQQEAEHIRREADAYALQSLQRLEEELERLLRQVRNGIATLQKSMGEKGKS